MQDGSDILFRAILSPSLLDLADMNRYFRSFFYFLTKSFSYFTTDWKLLSHAFIFFSLSFNLVLVYIVSKRIKNPTFFFIYIISSQLSYFFQRQVSFKGILISLIWIYSTTKSTLARFLLGLAMTFMHPFTIAFMLLYSVFLVIFRGRKLFDHEVMMSLLFLAVGSINFLVLNPQINTEVTRGSSLFFTPYAPMLVLSLLLLILAFLAPPKLIMSQSFQGYFYAYPVLLIITIATCLDFSQHCMYSDFRGTQFIISIAFLFLYLRVKEYNINFHFKRYYIFGVTFLILISITNIGNSILYRFIWDNIIQQVKANPKKQCWEVSELNLMDRKGKCYFDLCFEKEMDLFLQFFIETNQNNVTSILNIDKERRCEELTKDIVHSFYWYRDRTMMYNKYLNLKEFEDNFFKSK